MQQPFPVINNIGLRLQEEPLEYKQDGGGGWWGKEKGRDNNNNKKKTFSLTKTSKDGIMLRDLVPELSSRELQTFHSLLQHPLHYVFTNSSIPLPSNDREIKPAHAQMPVLSQITPSVRWPHHHCNCRIRPRPHYPWTKHMPIRITISVRTEVSQGFLVCRALYLLSHAHAFTWIACRSWWGRSTDLSWRFHSVQPSQDSIAQISSNFNVPFLDVSVNFKSHIKNCMSSPAMVWMRHVSKKIQYRTAGDQKPPPQYDISFIADAQRNKSIFLEGYTTNLC